MFCLLASTKGGLPSASPIRTKLMPQKNKYKSLCFDTAPVTDKKPLKPDSSMCRTDIEVDVQLIS